MSLSKSELNVYPVDRFEVTMTIDSRVADQIESLAQEIYNKSSLKTDQAAKTAVSAAFLVSAHIALSFINTVKGSFSYAIADLTEAFNALGITPETHLIEVELGGSVHSLNKALAKITVTPGVTPVP